MTEIEGYTSFTLVWVHFRKKDCVYDIPPVNNGATLFPPVFSLYAKLS